MNILNNDQLFIALQNISSLLDTITVSGRANAESIVKIGIYLDAAKEYIKPKQE